MASTTLFESQTSAQTPSKNTTNNDQNNKTLNTNHHHHPHQLTTPSINTLDSLFDDLYLMNQLGIDENDAFLNRYLHNGHHNTTTTTTTTNTSTGATPQTPSPPLVVTNNTNTMGFNAVNTFNILSTYLNNLNNFTGNGVGGIGGNGGTNTTVVTNDDQLELDYDWIFNHNPIAQHHQQQQQQQQQQQRRVSSSPCAYSQCLVIRNAKQNGVYLNEYVYVRCTNAKCSQMVSSPRGLINDTTTNNDGSQLIQLHQICFDAILNDHLNNNNNQQQQQRIRSNSLEFINKSKQLKQQQQQITCFKCKIGYLIPIDIKQQQTSPSPPQQQQPPPPLSQIPLLPLQHQHQQQHPSQLQQQQQQQQKFQTNRSKSICQPYPINNNSNNNNNNTKAQITTSSSYQSAPINIHRNCNQTTITNQRKRSLGNINNCTNSSIMINNPPLPTPMQPLHEYNTSDAITTPPPPPSSSLQMCNPKQQQQQQQPQNGKKQTSQQQQQQQQPMQPMNQYQSAPVAIQQRFRTLSSGSTGSFSASSSFSSNSIGACSPIWRKMSNNQSSTSVASSVATTTTTASSMNASVLPASVNSVSSASSSICTYKLRDNGECDESFEKELASSGNMFYKRNDWSILSQVPTDKQNPIHIRLEDEGPYGNDETRCFVLSHFSSLCLRNIPCVLCKTDLQIYDRFPLVDGTLFVSPIVYGEKEKAIKATISQKEQYIYGVCLNCLNSVYNEVKCKWCKQLWKSSSLQIGTLYKYDIFAAFPCCQKRCECKKCGKQVIDLNGNEQQPQQQQVNGTTQQQQQVVLPTVQQFYFSSYSEEIECPNCKTKSYHFIKPLDTIFNIVSKV